MAKHFAEEEAKKKRSLPAAILKVFAALLAAVVLVVGGYIAYLSATYYRIEDGVALEVSGSSGVMGRVELGQSYTAVTYNVGFGAYEPTFSFFMESGRMADGTETTGTMSTAASEDVVRANTEAAFGILATLNPDFCLLQEVDTDSTRSYHVDQCAAFTSGFSAYQSVFASNFHSGFIAYPLTDMHGFVQSGLLTISDVAISSATRRSYPIDESFPWKFFDLDRCFSVVRMETSDGHELVLLNSHMSAYDEGGVYRAKQLDLMFGFIAEERAKGNYVIAGGDWNHALCDSLELYESAQLPPDWVSVFDDELVPEGFSVVRPDNLETVASCRGSDIPYEEGTTYLVTVDGFIVSDNVRATARTIDTGFEYSDHNPVELTFELIG